MQTPQHSLGGKRERIAINRNCVCGKQNSITNLLCPDCRALYGSKASKWPEWLIKWMSRYQAELDYENNHRDLEIFDDETFIAENIHYDEIPRRLGDAIEPERNEWGDKYATSCGFSFMDPLWVMVHEKKFERHLAYLSSLPPEEKARRRGVDAQNDKKPYPGLALRGCRYECHLYEDRGRYSLDCKRFVNVCEKGDFLPLPVYNS
jgi:hypothetical protein